jgi:hypothetical protein
MTQAQLNRAVATATGESVRHIAHMGFSLMVLPASARPSRERNLHHLPSRSSRRHVGISSGRRIDVPA